MGITTKFTLVLAALGLLLFGGSGLLMFRAEQTELNRAIERETALLGRSLQAAAEQALQAEDPAALSHLLAAVAARPALAPVTRVAVFSVAGEVMAGRIGTDASHVPPMTDELVLRRIDDADGEPLLLASLPLRPQADSGVDTVAATLVIERPLSDMVAELQRMQRDVVLTVLLFAVLSGVVGLVLGSVLVSQPLARLRRALQRVQAGDLGAQLPSRRAQDEVGMLTEEFNRMVAALREARERLDGETEANLALQRDLQRAEKLITIGQLSAGLAHEIGSPLQVLGGRARQLAGRADLPADARSHAETIARQSERIAGIVQQLLSYARRRPRQLRRLDPGQTARDLVAFLEFDARRRDVTLRCELAPDLPTLHSDPDQIQQILFNLVTNALQATPAGGEVVVELLPAGSEQSEQALRIHVRDTGHGIAEADRPRLFEPFFTARPEGDGVGLGLAVVRSLVEEHGGSIELESAPGQGCEFRVSLPPVHPAVEGDR